MDESLLTGAGATAADDWLAETGAPPVAVTFGVRAARETLRVAAVVVCCVGCAAEVVGAAGVETTGDGADGDEPTLLGAEEVEPPPPGGRELMITLVPLDEALDVAVLVAELLAELVPDVVAVALVVAELVADPVAVLVAELVADPVAELEPEAVVVAVAESVGRGPCECDLVGPPGWLPVGPVESPLVDGAGEVDASIVEETELVGRW